MKELDQLAEEIKRLPDAQQVKLSPHLEKVCQTLLRRKRILELVQDALTQLRLDMKYITFDLECTRRERDELRRQGSD
jgi:hypothetical protein